MTLQPHIVVIGGGLIGLSCADELVSAGASVTIVEKSESAGCGASQFNSSMIHPSQAAPWFHVPHKASVTASVFQLAERSRELLQRKRKALKCQDIGRPAGTIQLFDDRASFDDAWSAYDNLDLSCERYAGLWDFDRLAFRFPEDESGSAYHYAQLMVRSLLARGCVIKTKVESNLIIKGGQCVGVNLAQSKEQIECDGVIIACGANSTDYLKRYGLNLPVSPIEGHALLFNRPEGFIMPPIPVMHWNSHSALTVFEDHIRLSGTIGATHPLELLSIWSGISSDLVHALDAPTKIWSASRPMSDIGRPFIGPTEISKLWINAGHGHMGWSLCAGSGELMGKMILSGYKDASFGLVEAG